MKPIPVAHPPSPSKPPRSRAREIGYSLTRNLVLPCLDCWIVCPYECLTCQTGDGWHNAWTQKFHALEHERSELRKREKKNEPILQKLEASGLTQDGPGARRLVEARQEEKCYLTRLAEIEAEIEVHKALRPDGIAGRCDVCCYPEEE